jgi:hypothetical protein
MNNIVWPELLNNDKLGHQIIKDFLKKATKKEILEKIWLTIKDSDPEDTEEMASDILFIVEEALGKKRCNELYSDLKQRRLPFRTVITFKNSYAILYLDVNGKFTDRENECAQFAENDEACCFLENSTEKCSDLFDVIAGTLSWHLEEFKDGTWVEVEPDDEFPD